MIDQSTAGFDPNRSFGSIHATCLNARRRGCVATSDGVYVAQGKALAEGAIKHGCPAIFVFRDQVQAGKAGITVGQEQRPSDVAAWAR